MKALVQSNIAYSCQAQEDAVLECLRGTASWCVTTSRLSKSRREIQKVGRDNEWLDEMLQCNGGWSLFQWPDRIGRAFKRLANKGLARQVKSVTAPIRYTPKGQSKYQQEKSYQYFDWLRKIDKAVVVRDTDHGNLSREERSFIVLDDKSRPLDIFGFGCYMKDGYYMFFRNKRVHLIYRDYIEIVPAEVKLLRWSLDLFKCKPDPICVATHPNPIVRKVNHILLQDWAQNG